MLPPAQMRTTQKPTCGNSHPWTAAFLLAALTGCTPPEQAALEEGSRLIAKGNIDAGIFRLNEARKHIENHPNLKTNLTVTGKLYNQLGLAHQILANNKTDTVELEQARKYFDLAINKGGPEARSQAYRQRALLHLEAAGNTLTSASTRAEYWELAAKDFASIFVDQSTNHLFDLWLEKGIAEFGANLKNEAKKSFNQIPDHTVAQNNLGNIAWQEGNNQKAIVHFKRAVELDKNNSTALFNQAVIQQEMKQYDEALYSYRRYLATLPQGNSEVEKLVNELEEYLKPEPIPETKPDPLAQEETEPVDTMETKPVPSKPEPREAKPEPEPTEVVIIEPPAEETEPTKVAIIEPPAKETEPQPSQSKTEIITVVEPVSLPVPVALPETTTTETESNETNESKLLHETNQTETVLELEQPKDWKQKINPMNWFSRGDTEGSNSTEIDLTEKNTTEANGSEVETASSESKDWKQRINPRNWFGEKEAESQIDPEKKNRPEISWKSSTPVQTTPLPSPRPVAQASTNAIKVASILPSSVAFPRYKYLNPALPNSGDRQVAKRYFDDGATAQKSKEWPRAKAAYIEATKADPAWFDARFELGQAAFYTGENSLALQSFENALAIDPNNGPDRFNFAMSLRQGSYYADAAREFETFLQFEPDNIQAHFEAGKLYAEQLNDIQKAGIHYKRVIGLEPNHPQAVTIRYWLIRNKAN